MVGCDIHKRCACFQGTDSIDEDGSKCCATVKKAQVIDLTIESYIPTDGVGVELTARGKRDVWAHERRRVKATRIGYNAYFVPAQGASATKCGKICRKNPGDAKSLLQSYLADLRSAAQTQYNAYNSAQQARITAENSHWVYAGSLADYYNIENNPQKAPKFKGPACPKAK